MKLRPGDYVYVGDITDSKIQRLMNKFIEAGAIDEDLGEFHQGVYPWLLWNEDNNEAQCVTKGKKDQQGKRLLTADEVLGCTQVETDVVINKGRFYLVTTRELSPEEVAEAIKANL